jgi:hypothetical protein
MMPMGFRTLPRVEDSLYSNNDEEYNGQGKIGNCWIRIALCNAMLALSHIPVDPTYQWPPAMASSVVI